MSDWNFDMTAAPREAEVLLFYWNWLGAQLVVSGHWHEQKGREFEATWAHSYGYGDADAWQPLPAPPQKAPTP